MRPDPRGRTERSGRFALQPQACIFEEIGNSGGRAEDSITLTDGNHDIRTPRRREPTRRIEVGGRSTGDRRR
jgi:hypothetical protein